MRMKIAGFRFRPEENGRRAALQIICFMLWAILLFGISPSAYNVFAHESAGGGTLSDGKEEARQYGEYRQRLEEIEYKNDIAGRGFQVIEDQIFPIEMGGFGEVSFIPAMDETYGRLILLFAAPDGEILYRTEQLETNTCYRGRTIQPNQGISAVSFQDLNGDGLMDIVLITSCVKEEGDYAGKTYKVGDVLFQNTDGCGFYRDYRISDKTATTLKELQNAGLKIISEQCYFRNFEKLGRLQVVPGVYSIAEYGFFMIYLVNEQGSIVWSLQPMGEYDNLYALKGINCRDIDGDGLKDIIVLARYSYEGSGHELIVKTDYAIYYQRTGGFSADMEIRNSYRCNDEVSMEELVERARAYWGW